MAEGYGSDLQRKLYVVPAIADGKKAGNATADFDDLEKDALVSTEVDAFVIDANELRGPSGGAARGGGRSSTPNERPHWGREDPYLLGSTPTTAPTTVTVDIAYSDEDSAVNGLNKVTDLVLNKMEVDAKIAVIYDQRVRDVTNPIRRVEIGVVTSVGEISDDNPSQMTFAYRRTKRTFSKKANA